MIVVPAIGGIIMIAADFQVLKEFAWTEGTRVGKQDHWTTTDTARGQLSLFSRSDDPCECISEIEVEQNPWGIPNSQLGCFYSSFNYICYVKNPQNCTTGTLSDIFPGAAWSICSYCGVEHGSGVHCAKEYVVARDPEIKEVICCEICIKTENCEYYTAYSAGLCVFYSACGELVAARDPNAATFRMRRQKPPPDERMELESCKDGSARLGDDGMFACSIHRTDCTRISDVPCCHYLYAEYLFDFLDILDANNVTYSLYKGTLLAAVRDNVFLPWDATDIDLCISKDDWNGRGKKAIFQMQEEHSLHMAAPGAKGNLNDIHWQYLRKWEQKHGRVTKWFCIENSRLVLYKSLSGTETRNVFRYHEPRFDLYECGREFKFDPVVEVDFGTVAHENGPQRRVRIPSNFYEVVSSGYPNFLTPLTGSNRLNMTEVSDEQRHYWGYEHDPRIWEELNKSQSVV